MKRHIPLFLIAVTAFTPLSTLAQKAPTNVTPVSAEATPSAPTPVAAGEIGESLTSAISQLEARLEPGDLAAIQGLLADTPEGVTGDTLGQILFMHRHWDMAAYAFAHDATATPDEASSLNNLAGLLLEIAGQSDDADALNQIAFALAQEAARIAPENAAAHNTLGNAARAVDEYDMAAEAGRRATALAPTEALYWTNLARSLEAMGDGEGAARAWSMAHAANPVAMPTLLTRLSLPNAEPHIPAATAEACNVNYRCQEICPRSIIGGLMSVTCEMENASAQMACREGRPYAPTYNCQEDLPEYGILIPGLNSGFSIMLPGFTAHVLVDGDGTVRTRVEVGTNSGRLGGYVRADGEWSPQNGASFSNLGGGVRVNVLPGAAGGGSAADQAATRWGHGPAHIELESVGGQAPELHGETYNFGWISL